MTNATLAAIETFAVAALPNGYRVSVSERGDGASYTVRVASGDDTNRGWRACYAVAADLRKAMRATRETSPFRMSKKITEHWTYSAHVTHRYYSNGVACTFTLVLGAGEVAAAA